MHAICFLAVSDGISIALLIANSRKKLIAGLLPRHPSRRGGARSAGVRVRRVFLSGTLENVSVLS